MSVLAALWAAAVALAPAPAVADPPKTEPFRLDMPARGTLTDGYGPRWGRLHQGIDIGILERLGVTAAADGLVLKTGWVPGYAGYGKVVLIGHPDGYRTLYAHLSTIRVAERQRVEEGDWIGNAGCTGSCTGTHLHFELHRKGEAVDPMPFIKR